MVRYSALDMICTLVITATGTPPPSATWATPTNFPPVILLVLPSQGVCLRVHTGSRWMNMKCFSSQVNSKVIIGKRRRLSYPLISVLVFRYSVNYGKQKCDCARKCCFLHVCFWCSPPLLTSTGFTMSKPFWEKTVLDCFKHKSSRAGCIPVYLWTKQDLETMALSSLLLLVRNLAFVQAKGKTNRINWRTLSKFIHHFVIKVAR